MIALIGASAVLTRPIGGVPWSSAVVHSPPVDTVKTRSAAAGYALAAARLLDLAGQSPALVCLSGPTGTTLNAFDRAWRLSSHGKLTGPGFAGQRSRRIHPFTLIRSLQNQVPAVLSMALGLRGACINALESATAFAAVLPNIQALVAGGNRVLLCAASAGYREEEKTKWQVLDGEQAGLEGAVCLLLGPLETPNASGILVSGDTPGENGDGSLVHAHWGGTVLDGPLAVLKAVTCGSDRARVRLRDAGWGYQADFIWRKRQ